MAKSPTNSSSSVVAQELKERLLASPVVLTPIQAKLVEETHLLIRKYVSQDESLADELIAERQAEHS